MQYELCATYDIKKMESVGGDSDAISGWSHSRKRVSRFDQCLDWITEKLDRKFVSAMERSVNEDPVRKRELNMLKRTVLVLVCLGLGVTAVSIKFAIETQLAFMALG